MRDPMDKRSVLRALVVGLGDHRRHLGRCSLRAAAGFLSFRAMRLLCANPMELAIVNRTPSKTLLDLTKYSLAPLGGSAPLVDPFPLHS